MEHSKIQLADKQADGYCINLRPSSKGIRKAYPAGLGVVNLVFIVTYKGMLGCGAFNVAALDKFNYPAAVARSTSGSPIVTIDELLSGVVKEANASAIKLGIKAGIPAKNALEKL